MPCFYVTPNQDDFNKIPELQVCIAEALYDAEAVLSNPSAFKAEELRTLRDQITSNLERAWELTGGTDVRGVRTCALYCLTSSRSISFNAAVAFLTIDS